METADRQEIRETFESWNQETLLQELAQRGGDFTPPARELLIEELQRRGVTEAEIEQAQEAYRQHLAERELPLEHLRTAEGFDDRLSASAAQNLLEREGIPSVVQGSDHTFFPPGLLAVRPQSVTLKVAEHDLEKARALLQDFAPAHEPDEDEED